MRPTPLPPGAILSGPQWRELGVSSARLRGPELVPLFRGYSTPRDQPTTVNAMCSLLQQDLPEVIISHTTAAALLRIPIPWWVDRKIGLLSGAAYSDGEKIIVPSTLPRPFGKSPNGGGRRSPRAPSAASFSSAFDARNSDYAFENARLGREQLPGPPQAQFPLVRPPIIRGRIDSSARLSTGPNLVLHRQAAAPTIKYGGLTLSHPYIVLLELASMLEHDEIVIAIDSVIGTKPPVRGATLENLAAAVATYRGRPGAPALRRALLDARANSGSPGETRTRLLLKRTGFPEPVLNYRVDDPDTGRPRYIDLAYPGLKIGIEYDGAYHRRNDKQRELDQARHDSLASIGWNLRRLTVRDIREPTRFLSALRRTFLQVRARAPSEERWSGRESTLRRPRGEPVWIEAGDDW